MYSKEGRHDTITLSQRIENGDLLLNTKLTKNNDDDDAKDEELTQTTDSNGDKVDNDTVESVPVVFDENANVDVNMDGNDNVDDDEKETEPVIAVSTEPDIERETEQNIQCSGAYNENEDEKRAELEDPNDLNQSFTEKRLRKCRDTVTSILNLPISKRSNQQVLDLWTSGFNLHDVTVLKECYSPNVTSQQFVNQELSQRDPVLQWLSALNFSIFFVL